MLSFHSLSLYNIKQSLSLPQFSWLANKKTTPIVSLRLARIDGHVSKKTSKNQSCFAPPFIVHAIEKDSQNFEIDSDKAKEALQKLDQQLQAFSEKQISPPKIRASDVKLTRDEITEEVPEVSGSALAYTAVVLFLFTIFYNIFFLAVLKPSIDGPQPEPVPFPSITATTMEREPPKEAILQLLPLMSEVFMQSSGGSYN